MSLLQTVYDRRTGSVERFSQSAWLDCAAETESH